MRVYFNLDSLPKEDHYSFTQLFTSRELSEARWFVTSLYDKALVEALVKDLGGGVIRSHHDTADTFFFGVVI